MGSVDIRGSDFHAQIRKWNTLPEQSRTIHHFASQPILIIYFISTIQIMSFVFRDPFFDAFDDYLTNSMPCYCAIDNDDEKNSAVVKNPKVRRDVITPLSGFGRMDVHENENEYEVDVDIPGMSKEDIKVSSEEKKLVIEGERKSEKKEDDDKTKVHFVERHFGSFHREVCLPGNALMDKIDAKYENGVLKVCIPKEKRVESTKKQITVN